MKPIVLFLLVAAVTARAQSTDGSSGKQVTILFTIVQDEATYERSAFGEPPQLAIWLQHQKTGEIRTVFVTEKTGKGTFEGKVGVPVALPAWMAAYRSETGRTDFPTPRHPVVDGITGPTTRKALIEKRALVDEGSEWNYYIEVNVAGDYNQVFPPFHEDGTPDSHGNGQPSLVYGGKITAKAGESSQPDVIGRTEQLFFSDVIHPDLSGIHTAVEILSSINVCCF